MIKKLNYFYLAFAIFFTGLFSVAALSNSDIKVENKKATFSKIYEKEEDAKKSVSDFEKYVKENHGKVLSTKVEKIVNEINEEILSDSFVVDDLAQIDEVANNMQAEYDEEATDVSSCKVVLGEVETIEEEVVSYEEESGKVGEYNTYAGALLVSRLVEAYENREDYSFRTNIVREVRVINTLRVRLAGSFNSAYQRGLYLLPYYVAGYDLSGLNIYEDTVTDYTYEQKEFETKDQRDAYIEELEEQGYTVSHDINSISEEEVEDSRIIVDEDFASVDEANDYIDSLKDNYNNVDTKITDNSYDVTENGEILKDGFATVDEAQAYLDSADNNYDLVYDKKIESYTTTQTSSEDIVKYFTSESAANEYLRRLYGSLGNNETLSNDNISKLSATEIDVNDIIEKGDIDLSSNGYRFALEDDTTNVSLRVNNRNETGTIRITSVSINGQSYTMGSHVLINDNSVASISGTLTYCAQRGSWNRCLRNETKEFTSEGIINVGNDLHVRFHLSTGLINEYDYEIDNVSFIEDDVVVSDNLIPVYKLTVTKESEQETTLYKASAKTFNKTRVGSFNVTGAAYNTKLVFTVDFTLGKDRTVYNVLGEATRNIYGDFYIVNYNAIRTIRDINVTYKQNYTVIKTTKDTKYLAEGEATIGDIQAPNTGIVDVSKNYMALFMSLIAIISYGILKYTFKDQN